MKKIDLENAEKINVPYRVPENYFESLTKDIQERISERESIQVSPSFRWQWAMAPVLIALMVMAIIWLPPSQKQASMDNLLDQVSHEEIEAYLAFTSISEYEIAKVIESTDEIPENDNYLEGMDLEGEDLQELLLEFNFTDGSPGS